MPRILRIYRSSILSENQSSRIYRSSEPWEVCIKPRTWGSSALSECGLTDPPSFRLQIGNWHFFGPHSWPTAPKYCVGSPQHSFLLVLRSMNPAFSKYKNNCWQQALLPPPLTNQQATGSRINFRPAVKLASHQETAAPMGKLHPQTVSIAKHLLVNLEKIRLWAPF